MEIGHKEKIEQLRLFSYFKELSARDYEEDIHKRNDVERWIENLMNASIDIAKIILGSKKKLIPESYKATMQHTIRLLKLPEEFIEKFEIWIKLRNVFAHEYLDIKWKRISDFIQNSEPHLRSYAETAKKFLDEPDHLIPR